MLFERAVRKQYECVSCFKRDFKYKKKVIEFQHTHSFLEYKINSTKILPNQSPLSP